MREESARLSIGLLKNVTLTGEEVVNTIFLELAFLFNTLLLVVPMWGYDIVG